MNKEHTDDRLSTREVRPSHSPDQYAVPGAVSPLT